MSHKYLRLALVALFVFTGTACADEFHFDNPGANVWNNVYVNPYTASETSPSTIPNLTIYCDDWNTQFSGNPLWSAEMFQLNPGNLSHLQFGNIVKAYSVSENSASHQLAYNWVDVTPTEVYDRYLQVAWLDDQFSKAGITNLTKQELSAAEWTIFVDPSSVGSLIDNGINKSGSDFVDAVSADLIGAANAVTNKYTGSNWDVIVPSKGVVMQEFLVDAPVPEPSPFVLLGTIAGLLAGATFRRKRPIR